MGSFLAVILCGMVIAAALALLLRALHRAFRGGCCTGCARCGHSSECGYHHAIKTNKSGTGL